MRTVSSELRALLPVWAVAVLLPIPAATFWHDGSGRAFAYAYLFLGCAVMAAESFRRDPASADPVVPWRAKVVALGLAMAAAVAVFTATVWSILGDIDPVVPVLAALAVVPALGCVPYLSLATGRPYAAVMFTVFLLAAVKMAGCVVARVVYGPTAHADGELALPWEAPNLLVWFCLAGALTCSAVLFPLGRREFLRVAPVPLPGPG